MRQQSGLSVGLSPGVALEVKRKLGRERICHYACSCACGSALQLWEVTERMLNRLFGKYIAGKVMTPLTESFCFLHSYDSSVSIYTLVTLQ